MTIRSTLSCAISRVVGIFLWRIFLWYANGCSQTKSPNTTAFPLMYPRFRVFPRARYFLLKLCRILSAESQSVRRLANHHPRSHINRLPYFPDIGENPLVLVCDETKCSFFRPGPSAKTAGVWGVDRVVGNSRCTYSLR